MCVEKLLEITHFGLNEMALNDITNRPSKFRLHVDLEREYSTLRSARVNEESAIALHNLRLQGCKSIDLWVDGAIYPLDRLTNAPPTFKNMTTFLRFVGDGFNGLLGYCRRLHSHALEEAHHRIHVCNTLAGVHQKLSEEITSLQAQVQVLQVGTEKMEKEIMLLKKNNVILVERSELAQRVARNARRHLSSLKKLPTGYKARKRKRQSMETLAVSSGAWKRRLRATR